MPTLFVGDVISMIYKDYNKSIQQYWKVERIGQSFISQGDSYYVRRCTKTGKEFRDHNGFDAKWIDKALQNPNSNIKLVLKATIVGVKADLDNGILIGKMKRRVSFLQNRIALDTKELAELMLKLQSV